MIDPDQDGPLEAVKVNYINQRGFSIKPCMNSPFGGNKDIYTTEYNNYSFTAIERVRSCN